MAIKKKYGWVQWLMPAIPALWKAEECVSQGQDFEASLAHMETDTGELLEPRRQRLK